MIRHHPDDSLLMALAAGAAAPGTGVVAAAHLERCAQCRARLRAFEALGGVLLDAVEPAVLDAGALERTLARIDALAASPPEAPPPADDTSRMLATLPAGMAWPRSLHGSAIERWHRLGPNVRFSRVTLAQDARANVYLLRVAAGKGLPEHTHRGGEVTQVLHGAFHDGDRRFAVGDFDQADDRIHHRPVAADDGECICLSSVDGRVAFDGPIARVVGALFKL